MSSWAATVTHHSHSCPVPPLAWRDWPFGAEPLSSASAELIRCHVLTAGCSVGPGPAGSLEEQNISYDWTVYLVLPPTPRPRPPRHSSLVHWDLFNDPFQWGKRSQFCPDTCLKMTTFATPTTGLVGKTRQDATLKNCISDTLKKDRPLLIAPLYTHYMAGK